MCVCVLCVADERRVGLAADREDEGISVVWAETGGRNVGR